MRPRVEGMNEVDDSILEFYRLQDPDITLPPASVHYNLSKVYNATDKSQETVARRMRKLEKRGLLEKATDVRGYYRMTVKGRDYLKGDITKEELQLPEEKPDSESAA